MPHKKAGSHRLRLPASARLDQLGINPSFQATVFINEVFNSTWDIDFEVSVKFVLFFLLLQGVKLRLSGTLMKLIIMHVWCEILVQRDSV